MKSLPSLLHRKIQQSQKIRDWAYSILRLIGFLLTPWNRIQIKRYLASHQILKLHLGCGRNLLNGWLNTDLKIGREIVFVDAFQRMPFPDGTFHYVFSEHMIEHLNYFSGRRFLKDCFRILKPGGKLRIATPDIQFLIELYRPEKTDLQQRYIAWASAHFFGSDNFAQDTFVINNFFRAWGHAFIYDFKVLAQGLSLAGFVEIKRCPVSQSDDTHLEKLESHGRTIGEEFNRLETLVVEALKPLVRGKNTL